MGGHEDDGWDLAGLAVGAHDHAASVGEEHCTGRGEIDTGATKHVVMGK